MIYAYVRAHTHTHTHHPFLSTRLPYLPASPLPPAAFPKAESEHRKPPSFSVNCVTFRTICLLSFSSLLPEAFARGSSSSRRGPTRLSGSSLPPLMLWILAILPRANIRIILRFGRGCAAVEGGRRRTQPQMDGNDPLITMKDAPRKERSARTAWVRPKRTPLSPFCKTRDLQPEPRRSLRREGRFSMTSQSLCGFVT